MSGVNQSVGDNSPSQGSPSIAPLPSIAEHTPSAASPGVSGPEGSPASTGPERINQPHFAAAASPGMSQEMSGRGPSIQRGTTPRGTGGLKLRRADLGAVLVRPMVNLNQHELSDMDIPQIEGQNPSGNVTTVIWGTNINADILLTKVRNFLATYKDPISGSNKYMELIKRACDEDTKILNLDTTDIRATDVGLYKWLISYPHEVLPLFDREAAELAMQAFGDGYEVPQIVVRPFGLEVRKTIRDLNPSDIDRLICVDGMVTRTSSVIPDLRVASFCCAKCNHEEFVNNEGGKVEEPTLCSKCKAKSVFTLVHNKSSFNNKQLVKMQEKPNDIPEGETPHAVVMHVFEANVDVCRPGDRVSITGILRALPIRVNPRQRNIHALFKTYIDVMHVSRDESTRMFTLAADKDKKDAAKEAEAKEAAAAADSQGDKEAKSSFMSGVASQMDDPMDVTGGTNDTFGDQHVSLGNETLDEVKAKQDRVRTLSKDPDIYKRLIASVAPNVWEMEDVKKGLLCQLFGGSTKTFPGGRIRGEINLLLVGDPSVSKSQLLSYVHALAPRGIYTSGKGSSAVGLTAYVTRDPETREMVLESGALVLSDRGICCIDEFDKMSDSARSMLHEAMEQQTVSVAKAGLISTLNARTSVCACANPIGSRYNPHLSVSENINLPPTLLTRFDLIYLVLDKCEEERDRRLARHLVSLFHAEEPVRQQQQDLEIPQDLLKEYIAFARACVHPKITDEAADELMQAYGTLRQDGRDRKVVVATPRQLESLIRLSESLARMRLSEEVLKSDVSEAVRLWYTAMSGSASSSDGNIDMDNIFTGATTAARQAQKQLPEELRALMQGPGTGARSVDELYTELQRIMSSGNKMPASAAFTKQQFVDAIRLIDDVASYDERTGVVRPRAAGAASAVRV